MHKYPVMGLKQASLHRIDEEPHGLAGYQSLVELDGVGRGKSHRDKGITIMQLSH